MKSVILFSNIMILFASCALISACSNCERDSVDIFDETIFNNPELVSISEIIEPDLTIKQGFVSQRSDTVRVMRDGRAIGIVILGEPVVVAQAEEEEQWGYFQFPYIFRTDNNNVIVTWAMREDSHTAYGDDDQSFGRRMSKDEGNHWEPWDYLYYQKGRSGVELPNGNFLQIFTPESRDIRDYPDFPKPVNDTPINGYQFFRESELPDELKGVYFEVWEMDKGEAYVYHSQLNDPGLLRYALNCYMPVYWRGELKKLKDNTLVTGVYGTFYQNQDGSVKNWGVSFYKSVDNGHVWDLIGKISFNNDSSVFEGREGFGEPSFEILKDGTWLCVMRTGSFAPMYKSFSTDNGVNWSTPEPFTANGVDPSLVLLRNGVLFLASGRPGLQLRFCFEGDGKNWTEPIEMLPFMDENGDFNRDDLNSGASCGYANVLVVDESTFYIVYSSFNTKNKNEEKRKSIIFRKVKTLLNPVQN